MTDRTWIGGGNNQASNPADWSPTGVPQPGDTLFILGSYNANPPNGTINISGNDLAGDTLIAGSVTTHSIVTINLSHRATLNLSTLQQGVVVIPQSTTINVNGDATLIGDTLNGYDNTQTINIGNGTLNVSAIDVMDTSTTTINRSGDGKLKLRGTVSDDSTSTIAVNVPVTGSGTFGDGGSMTFSNSVGAGITVEFSSASSMLTLDRPKQFHGTATLDNGEIDLNGLVKADSYTFQKDMLSIFSAGKIIDTLRLVSTIPFDVEKTASGVTLYSTSISNPEPPGIPLPIHIHV